jgi:hypothetical protein
MDKLIQKMRADADVFFTDAQSQLEKGNKAAGMRARKTSLDLEKSLKDFRKKSVEAAKK